MSEVLYQFDDGVVTITINRPEKMNALNKAVVDGLYNAWREFQHDEKARVAIITGAGGRAFCAGVDIHDRPDIALAHPGIGVPVWKPVIAAIEGYCIGGGFVLAMLCDLRIAAKDSVFAYPEAKLGIMGGIGPGMIRYMPAAIALEMLYTGERMPADRLYHAGFLNRVVAKGAALTAATEMARGIAKNAPLVLTAIKRLTSAYPIHNPIEIGAVVSQILRPIRESEDAKEGITAFKEKREPHFTGR